MSKFRRNFSRIKHWDLPTEDFDGRSKTIQFKIPATWAHDIDEFLRSPRSHYKDQAEFMRHAVYVLRRKLAGAPDIEGVLREFRDCDEDRKSHLEKMHVLVANALTRGPDGARGARNVLALIRRNYIDRVSDDCWRQRLLDHLDYCYGHLTPPDSSEPPDGEEK